MSSSEWLPGSAAGTPPGLEELRELNARLTENEAHLRRAIEMGRIGLWVWDCTDTGNSGDWSDRLKEIFGLPLNAEVTHDMFLKCVHPDDRALINQCVMDALAGKDGGSYQVEYRTIRGGDGDTGWVHARGQAFFDKSGRATRFIGTVMDITERRGAEESLAVLNRELEDRISERTRDLERSNEALQKEVDERRKIERELQSAQDHLRLAIDTIPGLVWSALPDGHIDFLNLRWLSYTGLTLEQARGWGWQQAIHPDDLAGLLDYWKSILIQGVQGATEARLRRHDGEYRWFLFQGVPLFDPDGSLVKWYGTNTDVEDLRASKHLALGQLEALSETLGAMSKESDPEKLLEHVLCTMIRQFQAHSLGVWELTGKGERVELVLNWEDGVLQFPGTEEKGRSIRAREVIGDHPVWSEFFAGGEQCVFGDLTLEPFRIRLATGSDVAWYDWLGVPVADPNVPEIGRRLVKQGITSTLCVPMMVAGKVTGLISIRFEKNRVFRHEELELARALSHQATLAIQLRRLSRQSRRNAVEAERSRLARDIHDSLAQSFTGIILQLEAAEDAREKTLDAEADAHIANARKLARSGLNEARDSVRALRSRILDEKSLAEALADLFKQMTDGLGLVVEFAATGDETAANAETGNHLLRIGQELLGNAIRHSGASVCTARLDFGKQTGRFEFKDNGAGFDTTGVHGGFGLSGIRERVEILGGDLRIESARGAGTTVLVTFPLPQA